MNVARLPRFIICLAGAFLLPVALLHADEVQNADGLIEFTSKEGKFSIRLPGKPEYEKTTVGEKKETQHQFVVGSEQGVYLVSYQENPNLKGSSPKQLTAALELGRDRLLKTFQGKLVESKGIVLDKLHPGIVFRVTIPEAKGEARCRFYFVGTRLYQVMAMGIPEFAGSEQSTRVLESFKLLP